MRTPPRSGGRSSTLWSQTGAPDPMMMAYTVGDDREWDSRLLRWDLLGSLGHVEGLYASRLLGRRDYLRLRRALRAGLAAASSGRLTITAAHEDVHSAVEDWITRQAGEAGARMHTGRSRNDQIACDLRLYLKDSLLRLQQTGGRFALALLDFAARHRGALWPGYTHQRRAMPSSAGLWAAGLAETVLLALESLPPLWARVDQSPLGSAAGYGVPLPLRREAAMRALGFARLDQVVTTTQLTRGQLETAVLAWCADVAHAASRCAADVVLLSSEEFGFLTLPPELATGSSIMPQKRNPDLFELTRARAAALDGDLTAVLQLRAKLTSGYHRDFQLLKQPLFQGLDRTSEMLAMMAHAVPLLGVDRNRALAALRGEALVTDEVMRRVEAGQPFRLAYRAVAAEVKEGVMFLVPSAADLIRRRRATGGLGNPGLAELRRRAAALQRWHRRERTRFDRAITRLAGPTR